MPPGRFDRLHTTDRADDQRTAGQRDRDRVLYTSALRRLDGVTQVVATGERYVFHNRLTHTLEVAQIARRLAEKLISEQGVGVAQAVGGVDPEVVEAAALAHDLGHPPFGHIAEEELDAAVKTQGVADGFEGNAQSFRVVTKLTIRHREFRGLNLTRATLNGSSNTRGSVKQAANRAVSGARTTPNKRSSVGRVSWDPPKRLRAPKLSSWIGRTTSLTPSTMLRTSTALV